DNEFHIIVREFLMQLRCGHTVAKPSQEWYSYYKSNSKLLPFEVLIIDDRIFIKESFTKNANIYKGIEITSIDEIPVNIILDKMKSIQPRDGFSESFVNYKIQRSFRTYYLFLFGQKSSYTIAYKNED
ncbi:MAG: hypothetical protein KJZ55_10295, partial [Flavobacteriales bacterium]|nr:hypothetical protein [Flavobacteriales bacterium]